MKSIIYPTPEYIYSGDIIDVLGYRFRVDFDTDCYNEPPWENSDCHGEVIRSNYPHTCGRSDKLPGWRPLNSPSRSECQFYYDWQGAVKRARAEGWNAAPYDAPNRVQRAVQADFDYLRGYIDGDWQYVGVIVTRVDADDNDTADCESCWGVETYNNYHMEFARDLINGMIAADRRAFAQRMAQARTAKRAQRKENAERAYWACRDVVTV